MATRVPTELLIDVPFGKLAARAWGPEDGQHVLALHGWLDSAGTFDTLIPHLNPHLRVVALDFSGHGNSSHRPPGAHYSIMEHLIDVRRAVDALKWNSFTILAHSMGATVALLFAGIFRGEVASVVSLDVVVPSFSIASNLPSVMSRSIRKFLAVEAKLVEPRVYSMRELMSRMEEANPGLLTEESKAVLLERGARAVDGGMVLKRDLRTKAMGTMPFPIELQKEILQKYKGNLLIVRAGGSALPPQLKEIEREFRELYRENCKRFQYIEVSGGHFVHLNEPEKVAPFISAFLEGGAFGKGKL